MKKSTKQIVDECNRQFNFMQCKGCRQYEWCDEYYKQFGTNPFEMNDPFIQKMEIRRQDPRAYSDTYHLSLED